MQLAGKRINSEKFWSGLDVESINRSAPVSGNSAGPVAGHEMERLVPVMATLHETSISLESHLLPRRVFRNSGITTDRGFAGVAASPLKEPAQPPRGRIARHDENLPHRRRPEEPQCRNAMAPVAQHDEISSGHGRIHEPALDFVADRQFMLGNLGLFFWHRRLFGRNGGQLFEPPARTFHRGDFRDPYPF